ncbi:hypothetical protein RE6C_04457 [Rhodopirellula europaea 6C]|uniref:Uncharacterized protein n=1 Tax=Rhodopirellula europaea 6C TaxID=1263867 RepID=M2ACL0_9BACT|nr:hypothetical protein RE6C_04457 [Rhodopirellula europaea 6C]
MQLKRVDFYQSPLGLINFRPTMKRLGASVTAPYQPISRGQKHGSA